MNRFKNKLLDLLLYLNPKSEGFKSDQNRKYIVNIMKYISNVKRNKVNKTEIQDLSKNEQRQTNDDKNSEKNKIETLITEGEEIFIRKINIEELLNEYSKIFENDNLNKILFHGIDGLINKEEYLEMFLMFLPEKKPNKY